MRRARAGLLVLGVVAALTLILETASMAHAASAPGGECTWHRHSKRVVRQRRAPGRPHRMTRTRHWWTCDPTTPAPAASTPAPPTLPGEEPIVEPEPTVSHLGVKALEWSYTLSRPTVAAGEVIVELNNQGEDSHNLKLQLEGSADPPLEVPEAPASNHSTARLSLPPGTYHLYCSLFEHEKKGMHATLVVSEG